MEWSKFEELKKKINEDLDVNEDNAKFKAMKIGDITCKILSVYTTEKLVLQKIKFDKEKLYGDLYHRYRFENDFQLDTKYEVDAYINKDEKYYDMKLKYAKQEAIVTYLEQIVEKLQTVGYGIRTFLDFNKLESGA